MLADITGEVLIMKKLYRSFFAFVLALVVVLGLASCGKDIEFNVGFVVDGEIYQTVGTSGNEAISMPQNPTKEGYTFDGWYWDEGVWKKPFTANSLLDTPLSSDMNVYAKWTEINAEPETPSTNISSSALNISGEIVTAIFSNEITTFSFLNDIKVADGASYILANDIGCQNTIASKTVSLSEGDNIYYLLVTNEDAQKLYTVTIRRRPIYVVEFNTLWGAFCETKYIEEGGVIEKPSDVNKIGYSFGGWALNGEDAVFPYTVLCNTTFNAKHTAIAYSIEYNFNSGENSTITTNYTVEQEITLENPKRAGYTFLGWFTEDTFENRVLRINKGTTGDMVFYAKWQPCKNKLAFFANGATSGSMVDMIIETDEIVILPSNEFVRDGYTFKGWSTIYSGSVVYEDGASYTMGTKSTNTLFAVWEANNNTLTFDANGGSGDMPDAVIATNSRVTLEKSCFTKSGYRFKGWSTTADGNVVYADGASYIMGTDSTYTLYAVWEIIKYSITYEVDGGVYKNPSVFTVEDLPLVLDVPTNNRDFLGWYTDDTYTVKIDQINSPENMTLYAKWGGLVYQEYSTYVVIKDYDGTESKVIISSTFNGKPITKIENYAFKDCTTMTSITISENIKNFGKEAFKNCISLTEIKYNATLAEDFNSYQGVFDNIGKNASGVTLFIGKNVTKIPSYLFASQDSPNAPNIFDIKFEENSSCLSIGSYAFYYCSNLIFADLPNSITTIGDHAFEYCMSLVRVNIPTNMTRINNSTFYGCHGLTSITIPKNITRIGEYAFLLCDKLVEIYNLSDLEITTGYDSTTRLSAKIVHTSADSKSILEIVDNYIFMTWQGNYYLMGYAANGSNLVLPNNYRGFNYSIYEFAFCGRSAIKSITIPSTVTRIDSCAFWYCTGLSTIVIPKSVTTMEWMIFVDCDNLTIYCEAEAQPSGWHSNWNYSNCPVEWGYKVEQ